METKVKPKKNQNNFPLDKYFSFYNDILDSSIGKSLNLRKISEIFVYQGTKNGVKAANAVSKIFKNTNNKPERLSPQAPNDLFDLDYNEEQVIIKETIQQFAVKMRNAAEKIDDNLEIPDALWQEFNELGLAYMQTPESLGGMMKEKSTITQMMIVELLAYGDLGQAFAFFSRHSVLNAIVQFGTDAQQNDLIPDFLADTPIIAAMAFNEPTPLFSPYELKTVAVKDGQNYIINGIKNLVPLAESADYFLISASIHENENQIFIIDSKTKGLNIHSDRAMGLNAAQVCQIKLENVIVDSSAMLGGQNGIDYNEFINYCKLGWCAMSVGTCQAVLDYVIPYANDRMAFGEPISNRQAVAFMIADMKIEVDSMRILTQRAAALAEQGKDFGREVYLAHVLCSDKSMQIGSNGVQLLGGHGFIRDFPVERWYRDLRAVSLCANGIHL